MEKFKKLKQVVPYILIGILIIMNMNLMNSIEGVRNEVRYAHNEIRRVGGQISGIRSSIQEDLDEDNVITDYQYDTSTMDGDQVQVTLNLQLNHLAEGEKVYLFYEAMIPDEFKGNEVSFESEPEIESGLIELKGNDVLQYKGAFNANRLLDYGMTIMIESESSKLAFPLRNVSLFNQYIPQVDIELLMNSMSSTGIMNYQVGLNVFNHHDMSDNDKVEIESAMVKVSYQDLLLEEYDLMTVDGSKHYDEPYGSFYDISRIIKLTENPVFKANNLEFNIEMMEDIVIEMTVKTDAGISFSRKWADRY